MPFCIQWAGCYGEELLGICKEILYSECHTNYGWRKQSNCIFYSDRHFQFRKIRDIRVQNIEIRLYKPFNFGHLSVTAGVDQVTPMIWAPASCLQHLNFKKKTRNITKY